MEEPKLWQLFLNGDKKALSEIFLTYHDDLFRYGKKIAGNYHIVEDCIQDLFVKLWNNRKNLRPIQIIKPYLLRSLRNHVIDSLESLKDYKITEDGSAELNQITYSHEDFLINNEVDEETRQKIIHALNQLKPNQKEIIYLRYFEDVDFEEIAKIMNMSVPSARNLLSKCMKVLRDIIIPELFILMLCKVN